jgi:hypothetical protein
MKKTLHGKRYLRSRASVQTGRFKKQIRKISISVYNLQTLRSAIERTIRSWRKTAIAAEAVANAFSIIAAPYYKLKPQPDGTYIHQWSFPKDETNH